MEKLLSIPYTPNKFSLLAFNGMLQGRRRGALAKSAFLLGGGLLAASCGSSTEREAVSVAQSAAPSPHKSEVLTRPQCGPEDVGRIVVRTPTLQIMCGVDGEYNVVEVKGGRVISKAHNKLGVVTQTITTWCENSKLHLSLRGSEKDPNLKIDMPPEVSEACTDNRITPAEAAAQQ